MNKIISQRIKFLNFFCMILLVFIHGYNLKDDQLFTNSIIKEPLSFTTFTEYFLANGLFRFRIPLLMTISGYLLAYKDNVSYLEIIKKKFRTLIIPYILISAISIFLLFVAEQLFWNNSVYGLWGKKIVEFDIKDFIFRLFISPIPFQLWYLRILFLFTLFYPVIKYCLQNFPLAFLISLFILRMAFNNFHGTHIFYFSLGIFLQLNKIDVTHAPKQLSIKALALLFVLIVFIKTLIAFKGYPILGNATFYILQMMYTIHGVISLVVVWYGFDKIADVFMSKEWFHKIVGSSFFIYAFHEPLMVMLIQPYLKLIGILPGSRMIGFLTLPIIILTICILFDALVAKTLPPLYNVLTGNRGTVKELATPLK